jgi:hypothetical protein
MAAFDTLPFRRRLGTPQEKGLALLQALDYSARQAGKEFSQSGCLQIPSRRLAILTFGQIVLDLLTFIQCTQAGTLHCRNVHKNVFRAIVRLNESEPLACVEPLHCSFSH